MTDLLSPRLLELDNALYRSSGRVWPTSLVSFNKQIFLELFTCSSTQLGNTFYKCIAKANLFLPAANALQNLEVYLFITDYIVVSLNQTKVIANGEKSVGEKCKYESAS